MSRPTLGGLELMQTAYSGFDYPPRGQVVPVLSDGTTPGGNAVLQSSSNTFRQATVAWVAATPADVATVRAFYEALSSQAYVDHDAVSYTVRVIAFSASVRVGDYWDCSATLLEIP